jgi:hypothetical protein
VIQLRPLTCCCADNSHLGESLPLIKWGGFLHFGMRLFFNLWMYFMFLKVIFTLLRINSPEFYASWGYFIFLLMVLRKFLNQIGVSHWKWILMFVTVLPGPLNPEHWDCPLNKLCDIWYSYDSLYEGCCLLRCDAAYSGGYVWMLWGTVCIHLQGRRRKMEVPCSSDVSVCGITYHHYQTSL